MMSSGEPKQEEPKQIHLNGKKHLKKVRQLEEAQKSEAAKSAKSGVIPTKISGILSAALKKPPAILNNPKLAGQNNPPSNPSKVPGPQTQAADVPSQSQPSSAAPKKPPVNHLSVAESKPPVVQPTPTVKPSVVVQPLAVQKALPTASPVPVIGKPPPVEGKPPDKNPVLLESIPLQLPQLKRTVTQLVRVAVAGQENIPTVPANQQNPQSRTRMTARPQLMLNLEQNTEPLVGLEYVIELQLYDTEPRYNCVLCDKMGDPRTIIIHVTSTSHRMKYFDKHYPSMMKELGELRYDKEARVAVIKVLEEVASAVEKYHGRMPPLALEEGHFKADRNRYMQQVIKGEHYSELSGPAFVQLVDKKKIANITRTVKLKADVKRTVAEVEATQRGRDDSPRRRSFRSRSRSESPRRNRYSSDRRRRSRTPERRREDTEKMDKYRSLKVTAVKEVETRYQEYELHPEKHPLYPAEWEAFWNRRYKELQAEGKDAAAHDFKPEWITFWIRRLKELFNADVEAAKRDIKIKLGLPPQITPTRSTSREKKRRLSDDSWSADERETTKRSRRDRSRSNSSRGRSSNRRSSRSPSRSTVQSKRRVSRSPSLDRRERIRELDRIISRLPGSSSRSGGDYAGRDAYGYDYEYRSRDRERYHRGSSTVAPYEREDSSSSLGGATTAPIVIEDDDDNEPVTVVGVLRILAALEEQLGSLGAKTLDMLAKALAMEKAKANSSDDMMMNDTNAVFFETIKEKLKGQLITGVLNKYKVNAVKKAIRKIAEILHEISKKAAEKEREDKESEAAKKTIVIKVNMDKAMIAQRIALALVTEKKTDVTPEQLEILINVFFEMLRKSKELNKMVTTQDYIDLLEDQRVQSVADSVDILGLIGQKEVAEPPQRKPDKPVVKLNFDLGEGFENTEAAAEPTKVEEDVEEIFEERNAQNADGFTDSDLQTLLVNFKDLSSDEQQHLIRHLKRLETEAPDRVEKLRKFVSLDALDGGQRRSGGGRPALSMSEELSKRRNRWNDIKAGEGGGAAVSCSGVAKSSGSGKPVTLPLFPSVTPLAGVPPGILGVDEDHDKVKFDMKKKDQPIAPLALLDDEDDDDDYSFDDVVKAASKNLANSGAGNNGGKAGKGKETEKAAGASGSGASGVTGINGKAGNVQAPPKERSVSPETKKISETHSLIANIMGSLQKKVTASAGVAAGSSAIAVAQAGPSAKVVAANSNTNVGNSQAVAQGGGGQNAGSLPFYQQQSNSYKSTYQEQIMQQQQQQQQFLYQQQMQQQGGYDMQQQQMMYQQQGNGQWWPNQNQMYNPQQQQQWNNYGGGPNNQYPNNTQNNYGNYF